MLRINKDCFINEDDIEMICEYTGKPLLEFARTAKKEGRLREVRGKNGLKTAFFLKEGYIFLAPFTVDTYMKRCDESAYFQAGGIYLKKSAVREISTKLNAGHQRELRKAKEEKRFLNLTKNKKTSHYFFMWSGRIYSVHAKIALD